MTAPSHCVLEGTVGVSPRRPLTNSADTGGLNFQDAVGEKAPIPDVHPSALDFKQMEMLLARVFINIPALSVDVTWNGSSYLVEHVRAFSTFFESTPPAFAKSGTVGVHNVTWTTGNLPSKNGNARVVCGVATGFTAEVTAESAGAISVKVYDPTGTPSNASIEFTLNIFGE